MNQRMRRVNEAIREIVAEQLPALKDPRVGLVTVTDVRTTTDLASAEVFYTVLPDTPEVREETAAGLTSARGLLRREVGARLRTRSVPELHFVHDPVPAQGRRVEEILRSVRAPQERDEERDGDGGGADPGDEAVGGA